MHTEHGSPLLDNNRSIKVVAEMTEWRNRPLDRVYPVLFIDAINVKVRALAHDA
jgi:transposase-like protein